LIELLSVPTDEREEQIVAKMDELSPDPEWLDHIFQSDKFALPDGTINVDAVVRAISDYKPIEL
jgi:hypothetical protein